MDPFSLRPFLSARDRGCIDLLPIQNVVMKSSTYLIILLLLNSLATNANMSSVRIGSLPKWVGNHTVDYKLDDLDHLAVNGMIFLQYENQVCLEQKCAYYKLSFRLTSETGVQNNSRITVNFDPSYQQLVLHTVSVRRGSRLINQLQAKKIKILHQEDDLDFTYSGEISAVIILDDIRKGDIIEYSYTIRGFNPIFGNKYAEVSELKW